MAAAFRGESVCECGVPECSPCPIESSGQGNRHWHAFDRITRRPIVEVSTSSRGTAETIAATMELTARPTGSPANWKGKATGTVRSKAPRTIKKGARGGGTGKGKGKAPRVAAKETSEEAKGNAKTEGKGNGKRKVPRTAVEEGRSENPGPRIDEDNQALDVYATRLAQEFEGRFPKDRCLK